MKIALYHNLPPGGAKRVLYEEIKFLSQKHQIYLYELSSTDEKFLSLKPFCQKRSVYKFKIAKHQSRFIKDWKNFIDLPRLHRQIAHDIDQKKYDVVLVHPDHLTQAPFLLRYLKTPSVYFCEELLRLAYEKELAFNEKVNQLNYYYEIMTRSLRRVIDRSNVQAAGKIVVASKYIQKKVKQAYNRRAVVCGLGGDSKIFSSASKKKPQILFIGDENEVSGYYFAKKVMELVTQKSQVSFCPISFQKGRPKLIDKQLAKKYAESLLTLCTSYQEPYGLVVTESMMSGTPVLAVAEGGYRETVLDGKTGYLLKRDVQDFAAKINYLLTHPQKLTTMSIMAARYAKEKFNWQEHVKKLEVLLES